MKVSLDRIPVTLPFHDGVSHRQALKIILIQHAIAIIVVHVPGEVDKKVKCCSMLKGVKKHCGVFS